MGHGAGGNYIKLLGVIFPFRRLDGGNGDIFVVGQQDYFPAAGRGGGVDQLGYTGVHGLPAADHGGAAGIPEQLGQPLPRSYRYQSQPGHRPGGGYAASRLGGLMAGGPILILQVHIVNLDLGQLAQSHAVAQSRAGIADMDMHPDNPVIANDNQGLGGFR